MGRMTPFFKISTAGIPTKTTKDILKLVTDLEKIFGIDPLSCHDDNITADRE